MLEAQAVSRKIVVGVDGSAESKVALRWALEEAQAREARLVCVHAWLFPSPVAPDDLRMDWERDLFGQLQEDAESVLETAMAEVGPDEEKVPVERSVVEGPAAAVLLRAAEGADLLVVGSRGLGGFRGLLLGSVSQQCAYHASCPVVIVRGESG